jgi:hypothetical protein
VRCGSNDRTADRGKVCGCGRGKSGCQDCGVCEKCGVQVPCGPPPAKPKVVSQPEAAARFIYVSQVLASAVQSHLLGLLSGDMTALQFFQTWQQRFFLHLRRHMTTTRSFLQAFEITDAAQRILIEGSGLPEPPSSLIFRFGSLTFDEKETVSSALLRTDRSGPKSGLKEQAQADLTSTLLRDLIALQPPTDSESQELVHVFLAAVDKVAQSADSFHQHTTLKWDVRTAIQGCGPECSQSHSGDGNCLVCGHGWGPHNGHTCARDPFSGRRGSWLTSSQQNVRPPQIEVTPDIIKVTFDPKSGISEGIQSEVPIQSNADQELGTIITFNITHSAASAPKVMVGLTSTPPPLSGSVASRFVLGLDLGALQIIGGKAKQNATETQKLRKAMSLSQSSTVK